jgi:hypothetical protein
LEYAGVVESGAPLATWRQVPITYSSVLLAIQKDVVFPLQESLPSVEELDHALATETDRAMAERIWRKRRLRKAVGEGTTTSMPLWAWRIGDALLAGQPNEAYSPFQTEVRRHLTPAPVVVMNLANGSTGYIPPDALYDEDIYQVWQTPLGRGSLGTLIAESKAVLGELLTAD